jgi:hypothetical protein
MRKVLVMLVAAALALLSFAASAQAKFDSGLINLSLGNKDIVPTGKYVAGAEGDKWNAPDGATGDKVELTNAKGDKTDVKVTFDSDGVWDAADDAGFLGTKFEKLLRHYLYAKETRKVTLSGLTPGAQYDLIVYSASNTDTRKTKFTVAKETKTTTYATDKKELTEGVNYAKFTATADADGNLLLTFEGEGGDTEGNLNGLQITPKAAAPAKDSK